MNEESEPFDFILQKKVLFKKIVFNAKNVEIYGILDEDWYIANNLANLRGMIFKVSALINSNTWTFSGDGEIMVLGEMVCSFKCFMFVIVNFCFNLKIF